jgi:hypothetical protein
LLTGVSTHDPKSFLHHALDAAATRSALRNRRQQFAHRSIVPKGLADVPVQVNIAGSENKASSELKRIFAQLVLPLSGGSSPFPRQGIIAAKKMQERALQQTHGAIRLPLGIDQKWEGDPSLLAKNLSVVGVAQADGG